MTKLALITGGSRGLGKNMALRLAEKGNDVIITYLTKQDEANEVVKEIESMGRKAHALRFDAGDIKSIDNFLTEIKTVLRTKWNTDKFDFLINNAGMGQTIPFLHVTEDDFDRFMNVHFKGVYFLTQKSLGLMNDGGRIINLSSGTTRFANPGYSIYASMKGAMEVLTRYVAKEVGARGITVNIVAPGPVETDFNSAAIRNNPNVKNFLGTVTALGRVGEASDIGGVVAFLCSEDAGWINGQRIEVSGGINL
ncbi:MAG: SDR family oxidoreductase [Bacteroidetes bacterium]|nr:SDR family oxidoreductase [Bacteroidota bacterium]